MHARKLVIAILLSLIGAAACYPQGLPDSIKAKMRRHYDEELAKASRRDLSERKIEGILIDYVESSEQAETSDVAAKTLSKLLHATNTLHVDQNNRVSVVVSIRSLSDTSIVKSYIESNGGQIEMVGKFVPFIACRLRVNTLRGLAKLDMVQHIRIPVGGHTGTRN